MSAVAPEVPPTGRHDNPKGVTQSKCNTAPHHTLRHSAARHTTPHHTQTTHAHTRGSRSSPVLPVGPLARWLLALLLLASRLLSLPVLMCFHSPGALQCFCRASLPCMCMSCPGSLTLVALFASLLLPAGWRLALLAL